MKSILLTSTALVAFAGAAAAEGHTSVTFGGEASAEYNTETGYDTAVEMTATLSATLDNGLTATAEITIEPTADDEISQGSITLSSETASLTFGTGINASFWAAGLEDEYDVGQLGEESLDGIISSVTFGDTTLYISAPLTEGETDSDSDALEVAISTTFADWSVMAGATGAGEYAVIAEGTVGAATLNFGFASNDEWDIGASYAFGDVTVGLSTDESEEITFEASYDNGTLNAGLEASTDETWEVSAGYTSGGTTVDVSLDDAEVITLGATYDLGNGLVIGAGMENADEDMYAFAEFDLGGGASAFVEYADAELEEVGPSERDIAEGTTVGVSFEF